MPDPLDVAMVPVDWRATCAKCGRFCKDHGTVYAPWGPNLEHDGYEDRVNCPQCGNQEMREVPVRWAEWPEGDDDA